MQGITARSQWSTSNQFPSDPEKILSESLKVGVNRKDDGEISILGCVGAPPIFRDSHFDLHPLTHIASPICMILLSLNEIKINPCKVSGTNYGIQINPSHYSQALHCSDTGCLVLCMDSQADTTMEKIMAQGWRLGWFNIPRGARCLPRNHEQQSFNDFSFVLIVLLAIAQVSMWLSSVSLFWLWLYLGISIFICYVRGRAGPGTSIYTHIWSSAHRYCICICWPQFHHRKRTPLITNFSNPVIAKSPIGIVSSSDLIVAALFIMFLAWTYYTNVSTDLKKMTPSKTLKLNRWRITIYTLNLTYPREFLCITGLWNFSSSLASLFLFRWQLKVMYVGVRFGSLTEACLALLFLPVLRGMALFTLCGIQFEASIRYHIWIGNAIILFSVLHGTTIMYVWGSKNILWKEV